MGFQRFIETGRVALVNDGEYKNKLVTIVDVIDQRRVLVDGPETGVPRIALRLSQINLTKFSVKFPHGSRTRSVRRAWKEGKIDTQWAETKWAKAIESRLKRRNMTDYDRFKLRMAKRHRNQLRTKEFLALKEALKKPKAPKEPKKGKVAKGAQ